MSNNHPWGNTGTPNTPNVPPNMPPNVPPGAPPPYPPPPFAPGMPPMFPPPPPPGMGVPPPMFPPPPGMFPPPPFGIHAPPRAAAPVLSQTALKQREKKLKRPEYPGLYDKKTRLFVGKIHKKVDNDLFLKLLETCGPVDSWNRVKDPNTGIWKNFGFCDYSSADSALRALRNLNGLKLEGEQLLIKADANTQKFLNDYRLRKMSILLYRRDLSEGKNVQPPDTSEKSKVPEPTPEGEKLIKEKDKEEDEEIKKEIEKVLYEMQNDDIYDETKQSESEKVAVMSTLEKMASDLSKEEVESKKRIIAKSMKRFREMEKEREREKIEKERERLKMAEIEKAKLEEELKKEAEREKERLRQKRLERERLRKERELRILEKKEKEREMQIKMMEEEERRRRKRNREEYDEYRYKRRKSEERGSIDGSLPPPPPPEDEIPPPPPDPDMEKIGITLKLPEKQTVITPVQENEKLKEIFNEDVEEEDEQKEKKTIKLINFDDEEIRKIKEEEAKKYKEYEENMRKKREMERKKRQREREKKQKLTPEYIISTIPKEKDELFNYEIDWEIFDKYNLVNRLTDWVKKKVAEYMGDDENLVEFILGKLSLHCTPQSLYEDLTAVLEEETEVFVLTLWRMLIYEIKRKKLELE